MRTKKEILSDVRFRSTRTHSRSSMVLKLEQLGFISKNIALLIEVLVDIRDRPK